MLRRVLLTTSLLAIICGCAGALASAQDANAPNSTQTDQASPRPYHLEYVLSEMEGGKKIDTRQYSVNLAGGSQGGRPSVGRIQIGTRVPVGTMSDGSAQYLDVGTAISGAISTRDGLQVLNTTCDLSSVAPDDEKVNGRPILRRLTIMNEMPIVEGKTMLVGTADDPDSKREFDLEVTVTAVK